MGLAWIEEIPPKLAKGIRFTIPENSSFCDRTLIVSKIENGNCHFIWRTDWGQWDEIYVEEDFANQMVREGGWVLI